jgi:ribonuclease HII
VGFATVEEICALNILQATGLAMRRAVMALATAPVFALVDGNYAFDLPCPVRVVVGGDALSASIAAASILAKTARDRVMWEMDALHPGYGFAGHKGYGVPEHAEALTRLGPCPIHRMTWAPVRAVLARDAPPSP